MPFRFVSPAVERLREDIAVTLAVLGVGVGMFVAHRYADIHKQFADVVPNVSKNPLADSKSNPLGLCGSPTGRTLSAMLAASSDIMAHMGTAVANVEGYATWPARFLSWTESSMVPHFHVHADGRSCSEEHHNGESDHHAVARDVNTDSGKEDASARLGMLAAAKYAERTSGADDKDAYLLDPTNFYALSLVIREKTQYKNRPKEEILSHLVDARKPCLYSLTQFRTRSGWWPEQCLAAVKTRQSLWGIDAQIGNLTKAPDEKNPALTATALSALAADIRRGLELADKQYAMLVKLGWWDRRSKDQQKHYDEMRREAQGFLNEVVKHSDQNSK